MARAIRAWCKPGARLSLRGEQAFPSESTGLSTLAGVMALWTREEVASDRLLGAFLAASVLVVLVGWVAALVYLFGFRLL